MHAHDDDNAQIWVVIRVNQRGLQRGIRLARLRGGQALDDGLQHIGDAKTRLGRDFQCVRRVEPDHVLDLRFHAVNVCGGQIHLVEHGHNFMILVDRLIDIGQCLRFDALAGINHQK